MRMMAQDEVGAGIDRGVCDRLLVGAEGLGYVSQSPMHRHDHDIGALLRRPDVLLHGLYVFFVRRRDDLGRRAGLEVPAGMRLEGDDAERRASLQWTTRVNEAYRALKDPVQRAKAV